MDEILISIITPTYNHEKYIKTCIESVLAQSYHNWEQIIIDDGSTDNTEKIIKNYKDERIKYIKQKNKGIWRLSETYNKALKYSKGEVIAILEGDDFWPPYKLEKQISSFKDPNVVLIWGNANLVNKNGTVKGYTPKGRKWLKKKSKEDMLKMLFFGNYIPACTVMCRRKDLIKIKGFQEIKKVPYVDHPTWIYLNSLGTFLYLDEVLGFWRQHKTQISSNMPTEIFESTKYSIRCFNEKYDKSEIKIGINDLLSYNFDQIKYNLAYLLNSTSNVKDQRKSENKFKFLEYIIYYTKVFSAILKVNLKCIFFIIKHLKT